MNGSKIHARTNRGDWMTHAALGAALSLALSASAHAVRYQAENATTLGNTYVTSSGYGYDGTGYIAGFTNDWPDRLRFDNIDVDPGLYELVFGYSAPYGEKGYDFTVGGETGGGFFTPTASNEYREDVAGLFDLTGNETIEIGGSWGYYNIDYAELRPYLPTPVSPVTPTLSNPNASASSWELMNYLASEYGSRTLAGQQVHDRTGYVDDAYLSRSGGLAPAVYASDFIDYSPTRAQYETPSPESERAITWAQETGGIVSMMWHWNAPSGLGYNGQPWWRGFYADATSFNLTAALNNPASYDYQLLLRDIHAIGDELQKFKDADVPVLWRPLHEAQGGWFWWGDEGADSFKRLWNLVYDELTNVRGLDNLIWVYTETGDIQGSHDWLPTGDNGAQVVDIVGIDLYNGSRHDSGEWLELMDLYDGDYLLALTETGDAIDPAAVEARGVSWSWFTPWSLDDVMYELTRQEMRDMLGAENIITLDELPVFSWSDAFVELVGDYNGDGVLDDADVDLLSQALLAGLNNPDFDVDENGTLDGDDVVFWMTELLGTAVADANLDFSVDLLDLSILAASFGLEDGALLTDGDFNGDGALNLLDLSLLASDFGYTGTDTVPEPTVFGLLAVAGLCRRRI